MTPTAQSGEPWEQVALTADDLLALARCEQRRRYEAIYAEEQRRSYREYRQWLESEWQPADMWRYMQGKLVRYGFKEGKRFDLDQHNEWVMRALAMYFCNNKAFEELTRDGEPCRYKLDKGILLAGAVGVGKTMIMNLYKVNKRVPYDVMNCKTLTQQFGKRDGGFEVVEPLMGRHRVDIKSIDNLWQEEVGVCFDDLGTEDVTTNFGNKSMVMADLILGRYGNRLPFYYTHVTTNLTPDEVQAKYGDRVWDRMKEMFNVIKVTGTSRRG